MGTDANLYTIDPSTGAATLVGSTGLTLSGFRALSNNGPDLYFADGTDVFSLDITTGAATLVGATGGVGIGALVFLNGTLYVGEDSPNIRVDYVDPSTTAGTSGPLVTGTTGQFYALAPVPEPVTWAMVAAGAAVCAVLMRRRRATHGTC